MQIELPNAGWEPRVYQDLLWKEMEFGCRRAVAVWHRRAGKDLVGINFCATATQERVGLYWHMLPTYEQGRKIAWEGMDKEGRPFLDAFPKDLILRKRDDKMTIWLKNGSIYQVVGTDDINKLMGPNPIGLIVSEYSLHNPAAWDLIRPILAENGGWAIFIYTPRGRNHGYRLFKQAQTNPKWFCQLLTVEDTNSVSQEAIDDDRASGMSEELVEQEYYCSWNASAVGAYYGKILNWMTSQDPSHIGIVPHVPHLPVVTGWDLGRRDSTAIWFGQQVGMQFRLIDYEECAGEDVAHYVKLLKDKTDYIYGPAYVPHDAKSVVLGQEHSVLHQLMSAGVNAQIQQKHTEIDQIQGVRTFLRGTWIDEKKCERGLDCLQEYKKRPIDGEKGPSGETLYRDEALHNWASHGASALATLVLGHYAYEDEELVQPSQEYVV